MALGADDALYLQTGLGLLWAGDQDLDDSQDLFPSSMGEYGLSGATKKAIKTELINDRDRTIEGICAALKRRLPGILYILSIPEIRDYVLEQMIAMNEPKDTPSIQFFLQRSHDSEQESDDPLGETNIEDTLETLNRKLDPRQLNRDVISELWGLTSIIASIYLRPTTSEDAVSLMEIASLYECAAVDVAVARDYNVMNSLAHSYRRLSQLQEYTRRLKPSVSDAPRGSDNGNGRKELPPDFKECLRDHPGAQRGEGRVVRVLQGDKKESDEGARPPSQQPIIDSGAGAIGIGSATQVSTRDSVEALVQGRELSQHQQSQPQPQPTNSSGGIFGRLVGGSGGTSVQPPITSHTGVHEESEGRDWPPDQFQPQDYFDRMSLGSETIGEGLLVWADNVIIPAIRMASTVMENGTCPLWDETLYANNAHTVEQSLGINSADATIQASNANYRQSMADTIAALFDRDFGKQRRIPEEQASWIQSTDGNLVHPNLYKRPIASTRNAEDRALDARGAFRPFYSYETGGRNVHGLSDTDDRYVAYAVLRNLVIDKGPHHEPSAVNVLPNDDVFLRYHAGKQIPAALVSPWTDGMVNPKYVSKGMEEISPACFDIIYSQSKLSEHVELAKHLKRMIAMRNAVEGSLEVSVDLVDGPRNGNEFDLLERQTGGQTLRSVKWAPIKRRAMDDVNPVMVYNPTTVAVCAASTFEHLIDRIRKEPSDPKGGLQVRNKSNGQVEKLVGSELATGIAAALKLKQIPFLVKSLVEFVKHGQNEQSMQVAMSGRRDLAVNLYRGQSGYAQYATHVSPMRVVCRLDDDNGVVGGTSSEFIGSSDSGMIAPLRERLMMATTGIFVDDNYRYTSVPQNVSESARQVFDSIVEATQFRNRNVNIAHLPVAFPRENVDSPNGYEFEGTQMRLRDEPRKSGVGVDYHPEWLADSDSVYKVINETHSLVNTLNSVFEQREALKEDQRSTDTGGTHHEQFSAERERRGAIWEDALRELSISQDKLYNFLRTMSGTLHESIESVVDFEDHTTESSNRALRERKNEIIKQSATFQSSIVQAVLSQVLRSSNLQFDLDKPEAAAHQLVVVNKEAIQRVQELASGASGLPFFQQNIELEQRLGASSGKPMPLSELVQTLQNMAKDMRASLLEQLDNNMMDPSNSKLEYLAKPKNSYIIRIKNEAYAAIKSAYSAFVTEWKGKHPMQRGVRAWELIEGVDMHLTTTFAEFAAHKLAHARMHSSSHAAYVGVAPARANAIQLRMTLNKLLNRALEYVASVPPPDFSAGSRAYTAQSQQDGGMIGYPISNYAGFGMVMGDGVIQRRFGQTRASSHSAPQGPSMARAGVQFGAAWYGNGYA